MPAKKINTEKLQALLDEKPSLVLAALKNKKNLDAGALFLLGEAHRLLGSFRPAIETYAKALKVTLNAEERMEPHARFRAPSCNDRGVAVVIDRILEAKRA